MTILEIILVILVVYYLIRILDRHVVPFLFGKPEEKKKKEPTITRTEQQNKRFSKDDGEYVDYEEID